MSYRCEATSVAGFIQQVTVGYLARGYYFYVSGKIPERKDPRKVDAKLIRRYGIDLSRGQRYRRKKAGLANMQYIRHERYFLLMATHGEHKFFQHEVGQVRDARRVPIKYGGYDLSFRNGHASVRIQRENYQRLKAHLIELAPRRSVERMAHELGQLQFEPYAPVRRQLMNLLRAVNAVRYQAARESVTSKSLRLSRRIVRPFQSADARGVIIE